VTREPGPARRLFFALWPDQATRRRLEKTCRKAVRSCGGRSVPPENYHITLAFLGNQPGALFDDIVVAASAISLQPMALELDRFGYWPKPRVFWLGPSKHPESLVKLAAQLRAKMELLGLQPERRPLKPHISLCRKVAATPNADLPRPVRWPVENFVLVESVTAESGAQYQVVKRFSQGSSHEP
jgi:2'-5' RNA ligase